MADEKFRAIADAIRAEIEQGADPSSFSNRAEVGRRLSATGPTVKKALQLLTEIGVLPAVITSSRPRISLYEFSSIDSTPKTPKEWQSPYLSSTPRVYGIDTLLRVDPKVFVSAYIDQPIEGLEGERTYYVAPYMGEPELLDEEGINTFSTDILQSLKRLGSIRLEPSYSGGLPYLLTEGEDFLTRIRVYPTYSWANMIAEYQRLLKTGKVQYSQTLFDLTYRVSETMIDKISQSGDSMNAIHKIARENLIRPDGTQHPY